MNFSTTSRLIFSTIAILTFLFFADTNSFAADKHHPLEKYKVEYSTKGFFTGKKTYCSKNWGKDVVEYRLGKIINEKGKTIIENKKVITKIQGDEQWIITVDLDSNTGKKVKNPMFPQMKKFMEGKTPEQVKTEMLKGMGGKVTGKKNIAGLSCSIWSLDVIDTCITDDSLNLENSSPSNDIYEVAVSVDKNGTCTDKEFGTGDAVIEEVKAPVQSN